MEKQSPSLPEQVSPDDWENTPETVKCLIESLLANAALSESESHLIQFLDATPIGIAVHDSTGEVIYVNQVGRGLLGTDRTAELNADRLSESFQVYRVTSQRPYPIEDLPSTRALAGETVKIDDLEVHRPDRVVPLEVWATPIFDNQGQVVYAIAVFQDISERKRRELEQQIVENTRLKREYRYDQMIQAQTDLILRSLPDTTITFANDALCLALGRSLEEMIGWQWNNFVPPEDLDELSGKIAALTPETPTFENINRDYRSNNQIGWTQWINFGIFDDGGELVEIQSVGRDITALQQQIQREQALNRVFQAIRNSLDLETIFATATAETAQLLTSLDCFVVQYLPEQGIWRHVAEFRHNPDTPTLIGFEIPDAGNPFAEQLKQVQIVHVEDTTRLDDAINREVAQAMPGAWSLIPLVIDGTLWGSFTISTTQHPFIWSDDQVELAQAVTNQLEVAIQQSNLYQQVQLELEERCRVETALRESEARFQMMADNVPGVIFGYCLRPDGSDQYTYISSGFRDMYGFEPDRVLQNPSIVWDMTHPDDVERLQRSIVESYQTLQTWRCQYRVITPSGQLKWLQGISRPTRQPNGDIIWDGLMIDISEQQAALHDRNQAQAALEKSEQRFRSLFESTPKISVQGYNRQRQVIYWNHASEQLYGYTKTEALGQQLEDLIIPPEMRQDVITAVQNWLTEAQPIPSAELSLLRKDGSRVAVYCSHMMLINPEGEPELYCVDIDLSDRKQAEEAMRDSEARYRLLAQNTNDLVCLHELDGHYLYVSPSCEALLGYQYCEMLGQDPYTFFHPDDRDRIRQEAYAVALAGKPIPITYRMRHKSGNYIWFETLTKPITNAAGEVVQLQTTSRDVTERIQVQNQLKYDALHDVLTGLPNRNLLMERLELAMNRAKRSEDYYFAVLFLDLDRFKVINDSLGHLAGDQLLIAIGKKLQSTLRDIDLVARLGGDEFVILLEDIQDIQKAVRATERIFAVLQSPLMIEGREVYTTCSIGIVLGTKDYTQAAYLLRDADIAMYRAKTNGKAKYEIFGREMHTQALSRLHLENDLRRAIECQEFVLHYQPIVVLDTGCLMGFEALIRWQHPTQGMKSPGDFIPVAEEIGLITVMDYWALYTACDQLAAWHRLFPNFSDLKVSVNLSAQDLHRSDLLAEVDRVLAQTQLPGRCLILEITESMLIEDVESTIHLLSQLKERDIQISIDDFGTGYSSLNYLHRLPVDNLKVDRSFVNQIQPDQRNYQIVEIIVLLGNQLELGTIAEGIETPHQLERLQQLGYKLGQGYLFSKPLSHRMAEALLTNQDLCFHE